MTKYAPADSWNREKGSFPRILATTVYAIEPEAITGANTASFLLLVNVGRRRIIPSPPTGSGESHRQQRRLTQKNQEFGRARSLRPWRLVSALTLVISIANGVVLPSADFHSAHDTETVVLHSVFCALPFLLVAFTASSLATLWPSGATRWVLSNRRYLGLAFAFAMAWHFAFVGYSTLAFGNHVSASDLTLDIVGLCFLNAMTLTSFRRFARKLIPADWRRLHKAGSYVLWFLSTYFYLEDYQDNHDLFYLVTGCVFLSTLLIRGLAWAKRWIRLKSALGIQTGG